MAERKSTRLPLLVLHVKVFLAMAVLFQVGYTYVAYMDDASVYQSTRGKIEKALQQGDYRLLAERRPNTPY